MTVKRRRHGKNGHSYSIDGEKVPGVTTIIGKTMPKPALIDWAARTAADEVVNYWDQLAGLLPMERHNQVRSAPNRNRDAAAKRGTEIHVYAGRVVEGESVHPPEEIAGHVDAYVDFLDVIGPVPLIGGTELRVASREHRYCGTVDLVADLPPVMLGAELIPASRWLLELKSTRSGIFPESALQASAYVNADVFVHPDHPDDEQPMKSLGIERCGVVWIRSDSWELRPIDTGPTTFDYFLRLRWMFDHADDLDGWIGETVAPAPAAPEAA
jgi:hypothetical protein